MKHSASNKIWDQSKAIFPGGVNSPVRAYGSVNGNPIALASGKGCTVFDEDKNKYLDFLNSWGPLILGHSHPQITKALKKQMISDRRTSKLTYRIESNFVYLKALPNIPILSLQ